MKKTINNSRIEGKFYEKNLRTGVTKKGVDYVSGRVTIHTGGDNTVTIDVFEQAITSKGSANQKYPILMQLFNTPAVMDGNPDAPTLKVNSSLAANDFYGRDGQLVTANKNDGGFITITSAIKPQATFEADVLIKNVIREVKNEEETGRGIVNGFVFDFRQTAHPIKFVIENEKGVEFFEDLGKAFIKVWGNQVSSTIVTTRTETSAFGDSREIESTTSRKELIITGCAENPYDEDALTQEDINAALGARETNLVDLKARQDAKASGTPTGGVNLSVGASTGGAQAPKNGNLGGYNF